MRSGQLSNAAARHRHLVLLTVVVAVGAVAYRFTLRTMFTNLNVDTPLAYLPLLPLISVVLAVLTVRRYRHAARPARDTGLDALIGIPLLAIGLLLITVVPAFASTFYWTERPDVLSLACSLAGVVVLLFGLGWLWRLRWPAIFLFLAWPAIYLRFLGDLLGWFTNGTNSLLAMVVPHLPIGVSVGAASGLLTVTPPHGAPLTVSVSSACAGAESVLGFLLMGGAYLTTRSGSTWRRLLWLGTGMAAAFVMNIVRIVSVLVLVALGHPAVALGSFHATVGLVLFTCVVVAMALLTPRFGLHPLPPPPVGSAPPPRRRLGLPARTLADVALVVFTCLVGFADASLAPYAAFADGTGAPTVRPFVTSAAPAAWRVAPVADYPWVAQYFGASSTFHRYVLTDANGTTAYADVVRTPNKSALAAYNVQNCFLFHRYHIYGNQRIDLGRGVTGLLLDYTVNGTTHWATTSWAWPVENNGRIQYERILLSTVAAPTTATTPPIPTASVRGWFVEAMSRLVGAAEGTGFQHAYRGSDARLAALARELVDSTLHRDSADT